MATLEAHSQAHVNFMLPRLLVNPPIVEAILIHIICMPAPEQSLSHRIDVPDFTGGGSVGKYRLII